MGSTDSELAIIFDLNGVIINDEPFQKKAWERFCANHNFYLSPWDFKENILGRTNEDILRFIFGSSLSDSQIAEYIQERSNLVKEIFLPYLKPSEGLMPFLKELKDSGIKIGLATSSPSDYIDFILDGIGMRHFFIVILGRNQVKKSKPNPEIYIETAKRLDVSNNSCIVFEDSLIGLQAAKRAGMKVIAITTSCSKEELADADMVISSFEEININLIKNID